MPGILDAILAFTWLGGALRSTPEALPPMAQPPEQTDRPALRPQAAPFQFPTTRMPVVEQWRRLSEIVERASDQALGACDAHSAARPLIIDADLEFQSIVAELGVVMPSPQMSAACRANQVTIAA